MFVYCATGAAVSISSSGWEDVVVVSGSYHAVQLLLELLLHGRIRSIPRLANLVSHEICGANAVESVGGHEGLLSEFCMCRERQVQQPGCCAARRVVESTAGICCH